MSYAIILYGIGLLAYVGWDAYCSRQNRSAFSSVNANANVIANVEQRVAKNIAQNVAQRRIRA